MPPEATEFKALRKLFYSSLERASAKLRRPKNKLSEMENGTIPVEPFLLLYLRKKCRHTKRTPPKHSTPSGAWEFSNLRKLFYHTTVEAAEHLDIPVSRLYNMECGRTKVDQQLLNKLQAAKDSGNRSFMTTRATPAHVKMFREYFNFTQEQAAKHLGVTRATINYWETGRSPCPAHVLETLKTAAKKLKEATP